MTQKTLPSLPFFLDYGFEKYMLVEELGVAWPPSARAVKCSVKSVKRAQPLFCVSMNLKNLGRR